MSQFVDTNNIYIKPTKFKTTKFITIGSLMGSHNNYTRRGVAEVELQKWIEVLEKAVPFHLVSATLKASMITTMGKTDMTKQEAFKKECTMTEATE